MLVKPYYHTLPHMPVHEKDKSGDFWCGSPHPHIAGCHPHSYHRNTSSCYENRIGHLPKYEHHGHGICLKQVDDLQNFLHQFLLAGDNKKSWSGLLAEKILIYNHSFFVSLRTMTLDSSYIREIFFSESCFVSENDFCFAISPRIFVCARAT